MSNAKTDLATPQGQEGIIRCETLTVHSTTKNTAAPLLSDVNFSAEVGSLTVIAGPNGAGKSTLLRALLGLVPVSAGEIWWKQRPLAQLDFIQRANQVAYVPQHSALRSPILMRDMLKMADFAKGSKADPQLLQHCMDALCISHLAERPFPELSGGERRLALIGRALYSQAPTLCLDEPMANLDIGRRLQIQKLLKSLCQQGKTLICVLHDLEDIVNLADRVVLLHKGKVAAQGTQEEVFTQENLQRVYGVRMQKQTGMRFELLPNPPESSAS